MGRCSFPASCGLLLVSIAVGCSQATGPSDDDGQTAPTAAGPVTIRHVLSDRPDRPVIQIDPCLAPLPRSQVAFGLYWINVRKDGEIYYSRLLEPDEIRAGVFKDLDIPSPDATSEWTVAVERRVGGDVIEAISNSIRFNPLKPDDGAVPVPPRPIAGEVVNLAYEDQKWTVDGQSVDVSILQPTLGPPPRTLTQSGRTYKIWDDHGLFAEGRNLGALLNDPPMSTMSFDDLLYLPHKRFAGTLRINGELVTAETPVDKFKTWSHVDVLIEHAGRPVAVLVR